MGIASGKAKTREKMFPIVHYYANIVADGQTPPRMALGGLFPDLASGIGITRDEAHRMGADFCRWCAIEAPDILPLARGIISHGALPFGVDYYADEYWPDCEKGWCFEQGKPWIDRIMSVTHLPERLAWWKSHNFVEMSYELLTIEQYPFIGANIMAALNDDAVLAYAATNLNRYTGKDTELIIDMFRQAPQIFALEEICPKTLAKRQEAAFRRRHNIYDANIEGMVVLLTEMTEVLRPGYALYMGEMTSLVSKMLKENDELLAICYGTSTIASLPEY
jgi:hypothetical protein